MKISISMVCLKTTFLGQKVLRELSRCLKLGRVSGEREEGTWEALEEGTKGRSDGITF